MLMAKPKPAAEAISVQVAAVLLMVSEKTIRRRIKSGEMEAIRFGKLWRIPKDVLARLRRER